MAHPPSQPVVVASQCLGFKAVRHDGAILTDHFLRQLEGHVRFITVCPEVAIGLGVPRDPIRIVDRGDGPRLLQPKTGADLTLPMAGFASGFLDALGEVDGFILKSRSPSCGIRDASVYPSEGKVAAADRGPGLFAGAVLARLPGVAVEDEGRLTNYKIREHFLTRIFTSARFRVAHRKGTARALTEFHASHKLILMAAHQAEMRLLGRIAANLEKRNLADVWSDYATHLQTAMASPAKPAAQINVLQHAMGWFKNHLTAREKSHFMQMLERYRAGRAPLGALLGILRSWTVRFEEPYLSGQHYFEPYPEDLMDVLDSGKGRTK